MSLALPKLDDLTWADLMSATRDRIPAASSGEWTLHAPVDPGMTLLELFAAEIEERVFWLDQVDDARLRRLLTLLGVREKPTQCARTVFVLDGGGSVPRVIDAGTVFRLQSAPHDAKPRFCTLETTVVFPLVRPAAAVRRRRMASPAAAQVFLSINGVDVSESLRAGGKPELVPSGATGAAIEIGFFSDQLAELSLDSDQMFGVLFDLEPVDSLIDPRVTPPQARLPKEQETISPGANMTWSYETTTGDVPFAKVIDGTKGLRGSGIIRLTPPSKARPWARRSNGLFVIKLNVGGARHPSPPRLRQTAPNAVVVANRMTVREPGGRLAWQEQVQHWRPFGHNELILPADSELPLVGAEPKGQILIGKAQWFEVADLAVAGPADRVFLIDREKRRFIFGDGQAGRLPLADSRATPNDIKVLVDVGGGAAGNIGAGLEWVAIDLPDLHARNAIPATGGSEYESIEQAAARAVAERNRPSRLVTPDDIDRLTREASSLVGRAVVAAGAHPRFPGRSVPGTFTVLVIPSAPRPSSQTPPPKSTALRPDCGLIAVVAKFLEQHRLIGQTMFVRSPEYVDVQLRVSISGLFPSSDERDDAWRRLGEFLHPLFGGDNPSRPGWRAGDPLRPSSLLQVCQTALGPSSTIEGVAVIVGGVDMGACDDVSLGGLLFPNLTGVDFQLFSLDSTREAS